MLGFKQDHEEIVEWLANVFAVFGSEKAAVRAMRILQGIKDPKYYNNVDKIKELVDASFVALNKKASAEEREKALAVLRKAEGEGWFDWDSPSGAKNWITSWQPYYKLPLNFAYAFSTIVYHHEDLLGSLG